VASHQTDLVSKRKESKWKKLAQSALNNEEKDISKVDSDNITSVASSSYIRKKINEFSYNSKRLMRTSDK